MFQNYPKIYITVDYTILMKAQKLISTMKSYSREFLSRFVFVMPIVKVKYSYNRILVIRGLPFKDGRFMIKENNS